MNSRLKTGALLVVLSTLWMAVWADAPLKSYKDIPSPERNARLITEAMQSRLGLTEKQYKKVYKIQLAEQKTIFKYKPTPQRGIEKDLGEMPLQGHRMEGGRPHRGAVLKVWEAVGLPCLLEKWIGVTTVPTPKR